jgi:acetyl esterase/lipase
VAEEDKTIVKGRAGNGTKKAAKRRRAGTLVAASVVLGLALTGCSSGSGSSSSSASSGGSTSASALAACPQSPAPAGGHPSGGAPAGGGAPVGGAPKITVAKSIKKSDTSTSTVISPTGSQMRCGKTQLSTYNNVVYSTPTTNGKQTQLKMDIQVPKTGGKKPLVIYITGGGFMVASQTGNLDQRTYVAEQGYVVASISYRTIADGATYKDGVSDVKSAIRYLRAHADQYGIEGSKVSVWGQSAGGYLAAMTGVTSGHKEFDSGDNLDQSSDVQAIVDEFGPSNLSKLGDDYDAAAKEENTAPGNFTAQWVYGPGTKESVAQYTKEVAAADPDSYVSSSTPPFVLLHGSADPLVSPSQTLELSKALKARGVDATRYVVEGASHGDMTFMGDTKSVKDWSTLTVMNKITGFLGQRLGS